MNIKNIIRETFETKKVAQCRKNPSRRNKPRKHIKHRGEAVLRKHLRTFEENQISNIIRRTKGERTLKFHEFYNIQHQKIPERIRISLENHSSPTENSKKPIFLNEKPLKKNRKLREKIFEYF